MVCFGVREKANDKVFVKSEDTSIVSLEYEFYLMFLTILKSLNFIR